MSVNPRFCTEGWMRLRFSVSKPDQQPTDRPGGVHTDTQTHGHTPLSLSVRGLFNPSVVWVHLVDTLWLGQLVLM